MHKGKITPVCGKDVIVMGEVITNCCQVTTWRGNVVIFRGEVKTFCSKVTTS